MGSRVGERTVRVVRETDGETGWTEVVGSLTENEAKSGVTHNQGRRLEKCYELQGSRTQVHDLVPGSSVLKSVEASNVGQRAGTPLERECQPDTQR